jgi:transposase-like protein
MSKKRKHHSAEFKAMVGMEALKGLKSINEISREYNVHPVQVGHWKKELKERLPEIFKTKSDIEFKELQREKADLQRKIGELTMDVEFLKKKCVQLNIGID